MGLMLEQTVFMIKTLNSAYVRCAALIVRVWGMPWSQRGATHYHAQLGLPDKGYAIKGLVVCYVVWL